MGTFVRANASEPDAEGGRAINVHFASTDVGVEVTLQVSPREAYGFGLLLLRLAAQTGGFTLAQGQQN